MTAHAAPGACQTLMDLAAREEQSKWVAVNDGVMGGRSSGGPVMGKDAMGFMGVINTNGGGFSSVRRGLAPGTLAGTQGLMVRVKTDGRAYRLTLRTAERFRGRSVSYTADIDAGADGAWTDVYVPFDRFSASVFGQPVPAAPVDPATAWSLGFIIGDGVDGPFEMAVARIDACAASPAA
ncbi:MAG: CIA30 family protein [Pseudomonadota bacterium]